MLDPFVSKVLGLHGDLKRGLHWEPETLPKALVDGLRVYDAALSRVQAHDWEQERKEREREHERRMDVPSFRHGPPRGGRRR